MTAIAYASERLDRTGRWVLEAAGCILLALWFGLGIASGTTVRLGVAAALAATIVAIGLRAPKALIISTIVWLSFMGLARRLLTLAAGSSNNDPLLLVAPCAVGGLLAMAWVRGGSSRLTAISRLVQILMVLLLVSVINPLQGGVKVGLTGLLFTLVPMAWFWVGRAFVDDGLLKTIFVVVAIAGVVGAVYGLTQTLAGFSRVDQAWIDQFGYPALRVQGTVRAFGPFVSASDYLVYLGVAFIVLAAFAFKTRWTPLGVAALVLVGWAVALGSGRGVVIQGVVALGMMLAASRRFRIGAAAMIGLALFACLSLALGKVDTTTFRDPRTAPLLVHQVRGLASPLDEKDSTLKGHVDLVGSGLQSPLEHPFGRGVGVMSQAAEKYGFISAATESDPSNVAAGLGLPGLLAYVALLVLAVRRAHDRARRRRDALAIIALGVLIVTGFQWLNGGNYAVAPLPWLVLGWLDRRADDEVPEIEALEDVPAS